MGQIGTVGMWCGTANYLLGMWQKCEAEYAVHSARPPELNNLTVLVVPVFLLLRVVAGLLRARPEAELQMPCYAGFVSPPDCQTTNTTGGWRQLLCEVIQ